MILRNVFICLLLFFSHVSVAEWREETLKPYKQKAEKEVRAFAGRMVQNGKFSIMKIYQTLSFQMDKYDKLLYKHYKKLLEKITGEDKVRAREAQRTWLEYRDIGFKINREIIVPNLHTGGENMWPLVASGRSLDIVEERLFSFLFI